MWNINYLISLLRFLAGNSEDCLFLNVFVPTTIKQDDKMAVMVWIHGGGFAYGTSTVYPAGVLASFNDVIVVSINYRLGVIGFLNIPGTNFIGNYGMLDQLRCKMWWWRPFTGLLSSERGRKQYVVLNMLFFLQKIKRL